MTAALDFWLEQMLWASSYWLEQLDYVMGPHWPAVLGMAELGLAASIHPITERTTS